MLIFNNFRASPSSLLQSVLYSVHGDKNKKRSLFYRILMYERLVSCLFKKKKKQYNHYLRIKLIFGHQNITYFPKNNSTTSVGKTANITCLLKLIQCSIIMFCFCCNFFTYKSYIIFYITLSSTNVYNKFI